MATFKATSKIFKLEELASAYGDNITVRELINKIKGENIHKCPKCGGTGYLYKTYNAYPNNLPDSGYAYEEGIKNEVCDLCNGVGYTSKKYTPKYKQIIEGFEECNEE